MYRTLKAGLALLLAIQAASAIAVTGMKYISTAGDYIGQGLTQSYLPPSASITATGTAGFTSVNVADPGNWWTIDFASPADGALTPGGYPDAARHPFNSPMAPGLSMYGNGRGCNTLKGWFRVREYELNTDSNVTKLAIDFLQNCEVTGPPLYGAVRINSDYPLVVPETAAIAGADFDALSGETATLDGTQSFSRKYAPLAYRWSQVDGPAVILDDASSPTPSFIAPKVTKAGATLRFRLDTRDRSGKTSHDHVIVLVESPRAPRTEISFYGDPGDYITQGNAYRYTTYNSVIQFSRNFDGGVSASISGDTWWSFDSATPAGTSFGPGVYLRAQRFPFQDAKSPGLDFSGDGRGCNTLRGKFVVYKSKFDSLGNPTKLDMTFEQHCEGAKPAAYGQLLLNAVPHKVVQEKLRAARLRYGSD